MAVVLSAEVFVGEAELRRWFREKVWAFNLGPPHADGPFLYECDMNAGMPGLSTCP